MSASAPATCPLIAVAATEAATPRRRTRAAMASGSPDPQRPPQFGSGWRRLRITGLKVALPAAAGIILSLFAVWPSLWPSTERLRLRGAIPVADLAEGADSMLDSIFTGFDSQGRPFLVQSHVVRNIGKEDLPLALSAPQGTLTLTDGRRVTLTARDGQFDRATERVDLSGDVTLLHPSGYEMRTSAARIDLPAGTASGNEPVRANGPLGVVDAEGFRVAQDGRVITFTGRSRMTITPEPRSPR